MCTRVVVLGLALMAVHRFCLWAAAPDAVSLSVLRRAPVVPRLTQRALSDGRGRVGAAAAAASATLPAFYGWRGAQPTQRRAGGRAAPVSRRAATAAAVTTSRHELRQRRRLSQLSHRHAIGDG